MPHLGLFNIFLGWLFYLNGLIERFELFEVGTCIEHAFPILRNAVYNDEFVVSENLTIELNQLLAIDFVFFVSLTTIEGDLDFAASHVDILALIGLSSLSLLCLIEHSGNTKEFHNSWIVNPGYINKTIIHA